MNTMFKSGNEMDMLEAVPIYKVIIIKNINTYSKV